MQHHSILFSAQKMARIKDVNCLCIEKTIEVKCKLHYGKSPRAILFPFQYII